MACKYYYNSIEYSSKEEFINKVIKPNFINNDKILRIQEFQQPDFLKQIRNNPNWINEQNFSETEKGVLNLLFGKNEGWIRFGLQSLIQNAAKEGYTKVRLPKGDTSAKVEGHTTLEEFKKEKEDRIKELEKEQSKLDSNLEQGLYGMDTSDYELRSNKILEEIDTLEKELERVETEGFGALKPIYNFYENTVSNILEKLYTVKKITDEYGNSWNEITITPENNDTIYFRLPEFSNQFPRQKDKEKTGKDYEKSFKLVNSKGEYVRYPNTTDNLIKLNSKVVSLNEKLLNTGYRAVTEKQVKDGKIGLIIRVVQAPLFRQESVPEEVNKELNAKIKEWLTKFGIRVKHYDSLLEKFGEDAIAVADFIDRVIYVSNNKEDKEAIPEEAMHFAIELKGDNDSDVQRLMQMVVNTDTYKQLLEDQRYVEKYRGDSTMLKKEAIGKIGARILAQNQFETGITQDFINLIKRIWEQFTNLFKRSDNKQFKEQINYILGKVASDIVNQNTESYNVENLPNTAMFRLSEDFKSEEKILKAAIDNTFARIRNLVAKNENDLAETQKQLLKKLKTQLEENNYRLGLYNFIASSRSEGRAIVEEFNALSDNDDISVKVKTLNKVSKYLNSYLPVLEDIHSTLTQENIAPSILDKVNESIRDIQQLQKSYINVSKNIVADVLKPFAEKSDGTSINIKAALSFLERDINFKERFLDAAAEANDDILKITDKLVKEYKENARFQSYDDQKDIINAKIKLESKGVMSATWIYERLLDGTPSGYFLSKYNKGQYEKEKNKFYEQLNKEFNLSKGQKPKAGTKERAAWARKIREWHDVNSKVKDNVQEIIKNKRLEIFNNAISKEQAQREWDEWTTLNIGFYYDSSGIEQTYYKGELTEPSNKYISTSWLDIYNIDGTVKNNEQAKAKDEFYKLILSKKEKADSLLPAKFTTNNLVPQMMKDSIERLKTTDNIKTFVADELEKRFKRNEDDLDFGLKITDENGIPLSFLPVYYTRKLKNTADLSTDIVTAMSSYMHMAHNYNSLNKVVDILEIQSDVLRERKVGTGQSALLSMFSTKEPVTKRGEATYAFSRYQDYLKMVVYGEQKVDEGTIFGNIDVAKTIDAFNQYVSINSLAANVYSGISNVTYGSIMVRQEAITGEYFTNKDLLYADGIYRKNILGLLGEIGKRETTNKLQMYVEYMNVLQDFEEDIREIDGERKTRFGQLANSSSLYFLNKSGEHWMQTRLSLALSNTVKLKTKEGKIVNLYDALQIEDGKLKLPEGLTIVSDGKTFKERDNGKAFTEKELIRVINKQHFINKRLHGIYNKVDKSAIQKYALGRLALAFRKFIIPGVNRRFAKLQYNYEGETYVEGYYLSSGRFMWDLIKDLSKLKFTLGAKWNDLQEYEKRNMYRTMTEVGYFIAAASLVAIVTNLSGDDDKDWKLNMLAYQANRLYSELRFYSEPNEFFKIMGSPAAGIDQLQRVINFIKFVNWTDEIETGRWKGYTRFEKGLIEVVPFASTVNRLLTPEEQLKYFSK